MVLYTSPHPFTPVRRSSADMGRTERRYGVGGNRSCSGGAAATFINPRWPDCAASTRSSESSTFPYPPPFPPPHAPRDAAAGAAAAPPPPSTPAPARPLHPKPTCLSRKRVGSITGERVSVMRVTPPLAVMELKKTIEEKDFHGQWNRKCL
jgi:hypothetical protein